MKANPQHSWFRIHLSTALLLTLLAGILMYVQTICVISEPNEEGIQDENWRYIQDALPFQKTSTKQTLELMSVRQKGLSLVLDDPLKSYREDCFYGYKVECYGWPFHAILKWKDSNSSQSVIRLSSCIFDMLAGAFILVFTGLGIEYWITAHAARKKNH